MNKKWEFKMEPFYDKEGIEEHFQDMAKKGWMIEKITRFYYRYKKIEPTERNFTISYYPFSDEYEVNPSDEVLSYREFLEHDGWIHVTDGGWIQIYYQDGMNPKPMETDERIKVANIWAAYKKFFLYYSLVLIFMIFQDVLRTWKGMQSDFAGTLASSNFFVKLMWGFWGVALTVQTGTFFVWLNRAKEKAEKGEFYRFKRAKRMNQVLVGIGGLLNGLFIINGLFFGMAEDRIMIFAYFCLFLIMILVDMAVEFFRKRGMTQGVGIGLFLILVYFSVTALVHISLEFPCEVERNYEVERVEGALGLKDVYGGDTLSKSFAIWKRTMFIEKIYKDTVDVRYEIVKERVPFLYEIAKNKILENEDFEAFDGADFGGKEAYRNKRIIVLCYEGKFLKFDIRKDEVYQKIMEDKGVRERLKKKFG